MFSRVATKYQDNTIVCLGGSAASGLTRPKQLADDMGDGWARIMQCTASSPAAARAILDAAGEPPGVDDSVVVALIPATTIEKVLRKLKRGKSSGPDELNNDFYRDHASDLAPILAHLFARWVDCRVFPTSFGDAIVTCLKKSAVAARPTDHRPISLLNSDYKVLTKIFANRLRAILPRSVHEAQVGFVPGRYINTALDLFACAKAAALAGELRDTAVALLFDFAKAYDSLQRSFLLAVLEWAGYSPKFVRTVAALHHNTSCRFSANGFLSRRRQVLCGIRQGCPMAPLLFIITLDSLYRALGNATDIEGVALRAGDHAATVKVSGYADDTAVYLQDWKHIDKVLVVMDRFVSASGLKINSSKSIVAPLNADAYEKQISTHGLTPLKRGEHCRYLGVMVGVSDATQTNWDKSIRAISSRLALAREKTHTVEQRAALAQAIIIPKITFVARHCWPTPAIVSCLHGVVMDFV